MSESWRDRAACRAVDPELFFPRYVGRAGPREALKVCAGCPVWVQCLTEAVENNEVGVWGGMSERKRRKVFGLGTRRSTAA